MSKVANMTMQEHSVTYPATPSRGTFHNIRVHARKVMKDNNIPYKCKVCGYSNFLEVCHLKAIADFTSTQLVSEVNALTNLAYLCPNHHKELDRGMLPLSAVTGTAIQ